MTAQSQINTSVESSFTSPQIEAGLINFLSALSSQHCSGATIRNYRSDIRQFYKFMEIEELEDLFTRQSLKDFVLAQHDKGLKDSSVTRKIASITQFALWCENQGLIDQDISWMSQTSIDSLTNTKTNPNKSSTPKAGIFNIFKRKQNNTVIAPIEEDQSAKITDAKLVSQFATQQKPDSKKSFASTTNLILPYLNLGLMILFIIGLGFLGYNQLMQDAPVSFAYPSTPTRADRVLSFQGRLTDTAQNPVSIPTPMEFKIWDQLSGGTEGTCDGTTDCEYQTGSCSVTPDQDGIFNVGIGDDCGIEIDDAVFTENSALWLEVIVDSETLTPRQPIRTVPFAVNSETVQGFPINSTQAATVNTILVMDAGGNVTLGENNPTLRSVSGTFTISGGTLSLEATADILFSDARVTDLPLSLVDTQIDPALSQGIVDAINDVYAFSSGSSFFSQTDNLIYPSEYWTDEFVIGGNSTSSADIWLGNNGSAVFNEQGNDADFRVESDTNQDAFGVDGASGSVGIGIAPSSSYQLLVNGMARFQRTMSTTNDIALNISGTYNGTGGTAYGFNGNIYNAGTTVSNLIGGQFSSVHQANSTIGTAIGMLGRGQSAGTTGQATDLIGVQGDIYLQGTGNATRGTAFYAGGGSSSGGDITTAYGLRVADLSLGLTNYAIYTEGTTQSYFGGNVGIGDSTPDHKLDVAGNIGLNASGYVNWGDVDGTSGYGLRDNSGTLQFKNSSGSWTDFGIAGNTYWDFVDGTLIPRYVTADVNIGGTSTDSAKVSLAGSLDRGKAAAIINQTENQDIFAASYSGAAKFTIANNGNLSLANSEYISNSTDDFLVFGGGNGSINTDLSIDLDGNNPVLFSTAGLGIEINDRLYIGTNNRYFYDDTAELRFSDDFRVDGSFAVGNIASTGNPGELITSSNITIGNEGELRLREDDGNGNNYTGFKAPSLLGSDIIYTLPDAAGGTGTVLMNDGSGNLAWGSNTAGDYWQLTDGMLSPSYLGLGLNIGDTATSAARVSISGALDRGMSALIINQTENQDIFTASTSGTTRFTIDYDGNLDVTGDIGLAAGNYINWGTVLGTSGYGLRDNAGTLQFKNDGGSWLDFGSGSGSGGYWQLNDGAISPYFLTTDANFGATATNSAKVSIAGSLTRGMSALIVNQTENQDIFTASASGTTRFVIANNGNVGIGDSSPTSLLSVGAGDLFQVNSSGNIVAVGGIAHSISNVSGDLQLDSFGGQINFANGNVFNIGGVTGADYNSISNSGAGDVTADDNDLYVEGVLEVDSNVNLAGNTYLNWGDTDGTGGYGIRDNAGTLQYKFSGGNWTDIGLASNAYWQLTNGTISPFSLSADVNIGSNATASAKVSLAGALDRGKAAVIINQTENQDIFAASASGVNRFAIDYGGNATLSGSLKIGGQLQLGSFSADPTAMGEGSLYYNTSSDGVYYYDGADWVSMSGGTSFWQLNDGALSPVQTSYEINLGNIATSAAKISLAGSQTRGKAAVIINQTENQDIFAASSSGVTKFKIENDGDVYLTQLLGTTYNAYNNIDFINSGIGINSYLNFKVDLDDDNNDTIENFTVNTNGGTTELFRIDANGNTGIGDTTPEGKLDVDGAVTGKALVQINELGNQDIFVASKSGITRMRIDNDGYVHSQRFVDLANSSYYLDPAATGTSLNAAGDGKLEGGQIYLYNTNTYVSGDGTDLTFKDSHLTDEIALSESGATQLHAGFTTNSIIAALNELMNISLGDTTNIFLNSLRQQQENDLLYQLFQDGVADEFEGLTGIDTDLSAYTYDSTNDWFSRANPTSDVVHDTQTEFLDGGSFENATVSASPELKLRPTTNLGDGSDGDATISATKNINSHIISAGRDFADGVAYQVNGIASNAVSTTYAAHGIIAGDEVILINMKGDTGNHDNTGTYEFLTVSAVSGLNVAFTSTVQNTYGVGGNANLSGQKIIIQRVPQYDDVTIASGGTLTAGDWDNFATLPTTPTGTAGLQTGMVIFRATGKVDVQSGGAINLDYKGYVKGVKATAYAIDGSSGESDAGDTTVTQLATSEGGGGGGDIACSGGSGGSYGTAGVAGARSGTNCGISVAGNTYGDANLSQFHLGSGGGGGTYGYNGSTWTVVGGDGGDGGGAVFISAKEINAASGNITARGEAGVATANGSIPAGGGGGGSGGSIYLIGETVNTSGTVNASGGAGGTTVIPGSYGASYTNTGTGSVGGAGGSGRIRIDAEYTTGTTTPTFTAGSLTMYKNYGIYTSNEISTPNTVSFDIIEWTEALNTYGEVQVMTRSGGTTDSTDGSWEEWRPITTNVNERIIDNMDVQANWTGQTPLEIYQNTQNEFGFNDETYHVVESGGLDGKVNLERYIDNGDATDGSISVSTSKNINTDTIAAGRTYADGISYGVTSISASSLVASATPDGIDAGDEILLINLQGDASYGYSNVGNYEFLKVSSVVSTTLNFENAISNIYGVGSNADLSGQKIIIQRVPNYNNVTIASGGTLTASDWNGTSGGVLVFRAAGTVDVQTGGTIAMSGKGYRAGAGSSGTGGTSAESTSGLGAATTVTITQLGGGGGSTSYCKGGGGGGHGTAGATGQTAGTNCADNAIANGGNAYGDVNQTKIYLGSGGGGGGQGYNGSAWNVVGGAGGDGGGIVFIAADAIKTTGGTIANNGVNGTATANGSIPAGGGGGGAGGAVYLGADVLEVTGAITASGGTGGTTVIPGSYGGAYSNNGTGSVGGAGGAGIIRVDGNRVLGTTTPTYNDGRSLLQYHPYGIFTSTELQATSSAILDTVEWIETLGNVGEIQVQTRTGNSTNATDGTWEAWKPNTNITNEFSVDTINTHTSWVGTNMTVAEGDVTRDVNNFEDEDESTVGNIAKFSTSTEGGYAERDLGAGVDLSPYEYLTFWVRSDVTSDKFTISMGENDATEQSEVVIIDSVNNWQKVYWDISDIAAANRDSIRYLRITNDDIPAVVFYLDNIKAAKYITTDAGYQIPSTNNNYIQYRVILSNTTTTDTPTLENLTLNYRTQGTHAYIQEGDITRNVNLYEDEDESTASNVTKVSFTTMDSYIDRDLGSGSTIDLSSYDYISFWMRTSEVGKKWKISMGESSATEQEEFINIQTANTWTKVYWDISDVASGSRNAIRYFRLTQVDSGSTTVYLDDLAANKYESNSAGGVINSSANEYIQYRIFLSTTNQTITPTVSSITINYTDQLGYTDTTQSDFDTGVEKLQAETTAGGTVDVENNRPFVGYGEDGSITVSSSKNINTDIIASGRAYPDGVSYFISSLGTNVATVSAVPNGIKNGDEVLLINLQGDGTNYANVGSYEFLIVESMNQNALRFTTNIQQTYGVGGNSNLTGQKIILQRVPHYNNVVVNSGGTLTANDWDGSSGGVLAFRASGYVDINGGGSITMDNKGYRQGVATGVHTSSGYQGESTRGVGAQLATANEENGGGGGYSHCTGGGGGSHATAGGNGLASGTSCGGTTVGASTTLGDADLTKMYLGGAGGGGSQGYNGSAWNVSGGNGGDGGGIVFVAANDIDVEDGVSSDGNLSAKGQAGTATANGSIPAGAGGGGAGGSMYLMADTVNIPVNTSAAGGAGGTTVVPGSYGATYTNNGTGSGGGAGGSGRIRIDASSVTGTTTPTYAAGSSLSGYYYPYAIFTSQEINTAGTNSFDAITWLESLGTGGMIQMMTRSGNTADSTDGTWEEWRPLYATNEAVLNTADTHGDWVGYTPLSKIDDTRDEFDAVSVEKFRSSASDTPSVYLDHYINDGDGSDGSITISTSKNINSDLIASGRTGQADGIAYTISVATASGTTIGVVNTPNGIVAGDEVLLINLQGASGDVADVGNYEFLKVDTVTGNNITFKTSIQNSYDGTTPANQKVVIQRVPQYTDVTIANGGTLTTGDWAALSVGPTGTAGYQTGILAFRATGKVDVQTGGSITTKSLGYRKGAAGSVISGHGSYPGEGTSGTVGSYTTSETPQGGGGGSTYNCKGGGGGSHATAGATGQSSGTNCVDSPTSNAATTVLGDNAVSKMYFGGGGGGGSVGYNGSAWNVSGAAGGDGGGILFIAANEVEVDTHPVNTDGIIDASGQAGTATANGSIPAGGGGGGAGGTLYIQANRTDLAGDVFAAGGAGGTSVIPGSYGSTWTNNGTGSVGGTGGAGTLRLDTNEITSDTSTTPTYSDGLDERPLHPYGIYTSDELSTNSAADFKDIEWFENIDSSYSDVQVLTRSGNTADSTTGTWNPWLPATGGVNELSIDTMNTHTNWTGTNVTVADGDITRNKNYYEDEDEATAGNISKFTTSTVNGYASRDLGGGNEVNLSNYNYVSFWVYGSRDNSRFRLGMGEAVATEQTEDIIIDSANTWQKVYWDISDISASGKDSLRYFRITYLDDTTESVDFYLDNIEGSQFLSEPTSSDITSSAANYIQYRLIFSTTDTTSTLTAPAVYSVKANYVTYSSTFYSQEGDVTRNVDYYEDEDELSSNNITRVVSNSTESESNFVEATITPTDVSNYDYISFWVRSSASATEIPMRISMGEAEGDEQSMDFVMETPFQWQKVFWDITDVAAGDRDAITKIRVTNLAPYVNDIYIDDFTANRYITTSGYQPNSSANNYFQYRAILSTTEPSSFPSLGQVSIAYSGESNVVSEEFESNVLAKRANLVSWADLGTGSIDYWASRDNGTTWTPVTMTEQATESGTMKIYSGFADLNSQPEGTIMRWKARITGNAVLASMAMRWEEGGGADLAEWYPTNDKTISAAEVVSADTTSTQSAYIARTTKAYDPAVIGVISTAPGLQIGEKAENTKRVALAGRIPVKVASDSAAILPGDFIASSNVPGRAMKATKTGYTIGKALEAWTPNSGKDWVMMFANLGTYIDEKSIGGIDNSSLEDIFGDEVSEPTTSNASGSGQTNDTTSESTSSGQVNEASESGEVASNSGELNSTSTASATLVKESLTTRLKKLADERLDTLLGWTKTEATISGEVLEGIETNNNFDSITKYQSDLFEARNKFIAYGQTAQNTVGATTINAYDSLNAARATVYGKLVAGSAEIYGKFTAVSGQFLDLFSNIIGTNQLQTSLISPIADDGSIHVRLGENNDASSSAKPALVVENSAGSSVTSIDKDGNIITLGTIISAENKTGTVTAEVIYAKDATISGNLDASSARIQELEARIAQVEQIKADTAEIVNATISGTLFAENIDSFSQKVAAAIEEPSLLAKLTGSANQNNVESVESYFASRSAFLADIDTSSPSRLALSDLTLDEDALVIDAAAAYVDQYLDVNGSAFVAERLGIGQSLVLSDSMFVTAGSIDFAPEGVERPILSLQPSGKGVLSLMGNIFTLDDTGLAQLTGNLEVSGDVKVGGTLLANVMKLNDFNNPFQVQLATMSGDVLGETQVQESRFEIINELGVPVATISAQGRAEFASGLGIGSEDLESATDSGTIESEKTSGTATIKANSSEIVIKSKIVSGKSLIYLTPLGSTSNQVLYVKEIAADNPETPEVESSFKVGFDSAVSTDLKFNWWIVN